MSWADFTVPSWSDIMSWLQSMFWRQELELTVVGLQNAGKTTLVNILTDNEEEDTIPTVGFSMKKKQKGNVSIKLWDLGGQPRFRGMWERYCRGVNAMVFVVDSADPDCLAVAGRELHDLIKKPSLEGIPLLVLGNKNDVEGALGVIELIAGLDLESIKHREVSCYSISAHQGINVALTIEWLMQKASSKKR